MVPRGVQQLSEAAQIAGDLASADVDQALVERLSRLKAALEKIAAAPLARSGLAVPLTAPINRNARKLQACSDDSFSAALESLEKVVANFEKRAGGAGNIAIT